MSPLQLDAADTSTIILSPASQAFVDARATTLGPWVIGGSLDCILLGVVLCQVQHFFRSRRMNLENDQKGGYESHLVCLVLLLSVLKTCQAIAIVWEQNVMAFVNPDFARLMANAEWWQVSAPLMTGITGFCVQSFYAFRFYKLTRQWWATIPIFAAMLLGIIGGSFSTYHITKNHTKQKVTWLLIHLVSVCITDILITLGTVWALQRRNSGLATTTSLIHRLLRLVFEAAVPPAFIATIDLILTQTLGSKLYWHLVLNYSLAKLYVISLLYTLNSIDDYRTERVTSGKLSFSHATNGNRRYTRGNNDFELGSRLNEIQITTQVSTHLSPPALKQDTAVDMLHRQPMQSFKAKMLDDDDTLTSEYAKAM